MPALLNSDRICELTPHYDFYYLRNTAWTFQLDLDPNNDVCGTQQSIDNDGDLSDIPTVREDELPPFFDHATVYWQVVTRERDDGAGGGVGGTFNGQNGAVISRAGSAWEASAFCYYNASDIVSSEFSVTAEPGISASGKNEFTYKMEVARSSDFSSFYTGNEVPTTILNSDLNVRVTFQDDTLVNGYTVVTSDCWATQTSDPDDPTRFALETDFCPDTDSTFQRVASPSVDMEYFQFMAFGWYLNGAVTTNTVYLHCTVLACPPEDTTACDLPTCTTKRQRRALGALANHQSAALRSEQEAKLVTSPPIVVMRREVEELQIARSPINNNYSPFTTALACVFSVGAMLSLIVVGGLFLCRRNKIQANYQRLSSGPSDNFGI
ncbi:zona pellucida sperm-binding protein 4-like [Symsagittifera roscoffensis]|uniref:zona pellucida sperm-binding protein 4-like n=1 Tax=Symsagittifera roscoffensis TaxID=84072 RepID=UPI00307C4B19